MTENPYTSPQTTPQEFSTQTAPQHIELASRWARLGAAIIDGLIMMLVFLPLLALVMGVLFASSSQGSTDFFSNISSAQNSVSANIVSAVMGIGVYVAINGYFLIKTGQSVGKKALGIQIVSRETYQLLSFGKVVGIRYILTVLLSQIPFLGGLFGLVDTLFIFSAEKRCIHDLMAGTIVIKSSSI